MARQPLLSIAHDIQCHLSRERNLAKKHIKRPRLYLFHLLRSLISPQHQFIFHSPRLPCKQTQHIGKHHPQHKPSRARVLCLYPAMCEDLDKRKRGFGPVPPSPHLVLCVFCVVVVLWIVVLCSSQTHNCMVGLEDLAGVTMTGLDLGLSFLFSSLFLLRKRTLAQTGTLASDRHVTQPAPWTYTSTQSFVPCACAFLSARVPACRRRLEVSSVTSPAMPCFCAVSGIIAALTRRVARHSTVCTRMGRRLRAQHGVGVEAAPSAIQLACARKKSIPVLGQGLSLLDPIEGTRWLFARVEREKKHNVGEGWHTRPGAGGPDVRLGRAGSKPRRGESASSTEISAACRPDWQDGEVPAGKEIEMPWLADTSTKSKTRPWPPMGIGDRPGGWLLREGFRGHKPQTLLGARCAWLAPNRRFQMQVMSDCILSSYGGWFRSISLGC